MKPGLSLRVSQHLALTPQLQQSIRLLQLSTLELGQEVEQMLDENPFLERNADEAVREEFGLEHADTPVQADEYSADDAIYSGAASASSTSAEATSDAQGDASGDADYTSSTASDEPDWGGDGTVEMAPNDSECGVDCAMKSSGFGSTTASRRVTVAVAVVVAMTVVVAEADRRTSGARTGGMPLPANSLNTLNSRAPSFVVTAARPSFPRPANFARPASRPRFDLHAPA
eukprot:gene39420-48715_t